MADTVHEVEIEHNLDEYTQKIEEANKLWDAHLTKIRSVNNILAQIYGRRVGGPGGGGGASGGAGGGGGAGGAAGNPNVPGTTAYNNLNTQYMRQALNYFKAFPAQTKVLSQFSSTLQGMMGGLARFARGGFVAGTADLALEAAKFTIDRGSSFRDRAAQAAAYGTLPYQQQAFANNLKMYTGGDAGAQALFGGLVQQQTQIGGPAYLRNFLARFGVKTTGKESQEDLAGDVLLAERKMSQTVDPQLWQKYAEIFKVGNVADISTMMRFRSQGTTEAQLRADLEKAHTEGAGGTEGKDLITVTQQLANGIISLEKKLDEWADKIAGSILNFERGLQGHPPDPTIKPGYNPPKAPGEPWHFGIPDFAPAWDKLKGLFGKAGSGVSSLFGISSAQAGELTAGSELAGKAAEVPDNIATIKDILNRAFPPTADPLGTADTGGGAGFGGTHVPLGIRMRGSGKSFGANTATGGGDVGGGLTLTASGSKISPEERALLDVMAMHESGKKSYLSNDPDYGAAFQGNRYQFLGSTWESNARAIGADPKDLSPENQDRVALHLIKSIAGSKLQEIEKNPALIKGMFGPTWHGVWSVDTAAAFQKALDAEKAADAGKAKPADGDTVKKADGAPSAATTDAVRKAAKAPKANIHIPNIYGSDSGVSSEYPAKTEKSGSDIPGKQSMNNMGIFQQDKGTHIRVSNTAGASVVVQSMLLGAVKGSYA